jgi:hypothetical protein
LRALARASRKDLNAGERPVQSIQAVQVFLTNLGFKLNPPAHLFLVL